MWIDYWLLYWELKIAMFGKDYIAIKIVIFKTQLKSKIKVEENIFRAVYQVWYHKI